MAIYTHKSGDLRKMGFNYVSLPPQVIQAISNPDALAIWTYLQSHSEHWTVRRTQIMDHFSLGRVRYDKAIKELKALRLYWVENIKNPENNQFTDREIWVSSLPKEKMQDIQEILQMPLSFNGSLEEWRERVDKSGDNPKTAPRLDFPQVGNPPSRGNSTTAENRPLNELSIYNKQSCNITNDQEREREPQAPTVQQETAPQQDKRKKRVDKGVEITLDWTPPLADVMQISETTMIEMDFMIDVVVPSFSAYQNGKVLGDVTAELQRWAVRENAYHKRLKNNG